MTPAVQSQIVKRLALAAGFDRVGIAPASPLERAEYYRDWLAAGHAGSMSYLGRHQELRTDPAQILPEAKSVICVAVNYKREDGPAAAAHNSAGQKAKSEQAAEEVSVAISDAGGRFPAPLAGASRSDVSDARLDDAERAAPTGRVAMYARGEDYHIVLHRMLADLVAKLRAGIGAPFEARPFVDTGPLIERELAARAGIGWIGKNTLVLSAGLGSYFFLGEIITTLELVPDEPIPDHCGTCTRCLDACPTQAFIAPYQMDASRCISYLTIEHRGEIAPELAARMGDWVYGCDICQEVCPHNARAPLATNAAVRAPRIPARVSLRVIHDMRSGEYKRLVAGTAARRASRPMWRRNAAIARRNAAAVLANASCALHAEK